MPPCIILSFHPVCRSTPSSTLGRRTRQGQTPPASPSPTMASLWLHVEVRTIFFFALLELYTFFEAPRFKVPLSRYISLSLFFIACKSTHCGSLNRKFGVFGYPVCSLSETNRSNSTRESFMLHFSVM